MKVAQGLRYSQFRRKPSVRASGLTDLGRVRDTNQDAFHVNVESGLFMVCDGNGGRLGGSIAAHAVTRILPVMVELRGATAQQEVPASVRAVLTKSLAALSMMLYEWKKGEPRILRGGTTVAMALLSGEHLYVANLGDSRVYLLRNGFLRQLTRDHSLVADLVELGVITREQAKTHHLLHVIMRNMGGPFPEVHDIVHRFKVADGDRLLLCCDGLWGTIPDSELSRILREGGDCEKTCARLIEEANRAGGKDNITAVVVDTGSR